VVVEGLGRGLPSEGLAGAGVEVQSDGIEVLDGVLAEVCALGEVLA